MEEINLLSFRTGDAAILVSAISGLPDGITDGLSETDLACYSAIASEKRKQEFLAVRHALNGLLGRKAEIHYDESGKPSLADNISRISISHSKSHVAVIAHPSREVGIDIEDATDKFLKLYKRFLGEQEQSDLGNGNDIRKLQIAWSAKEALYKIIGLQAVDFANQLQVLPFEFKTEGIIQVKHIPADRLYEVHYTCTETYTLAYCIA